MKKGVVCYNVFHDVQRHVPEQLRARQHDFGRGLGKDVRSKGNAINMRVEPWICPTEVGNGGEQIHSYDWDIDSTLVRLDDRRPV